jgi:cell wall-associated NlpC family hydrolase
MTLRERICTEALTWVGVPYHDLQHSRYGCCCGGFIIGVAKALGLLHGDWKPPAYSPERHFHQSEDLMSPLLARCGCTPVPWEDKQPGDVLTFRIGGLTVSHAAFLLPGNEVVHALVDKGIVRQPLQGSWVALHDRAWAFPGVEATACP